MTELSPSTVDVSEVAELRRRLTDALQSADVWRSRHATSERQREMSARLLRDARQEIERLQTDLIRANERIVAQNQLLAERESGQVPA